MKNSSPVAMLADRILGFVLAIELLEQDSQTEEFCDLLRLASDLVLPYVPRLETALKRFATSAPPQSELCRSRNLVDSELPEILSRLNNLERWRASLSTFSLPISGDKDLDPKHPGVSCFEVVFLQPQLAAVPQSV